MKVLFYRYTNICEPDIIQAFHELGHTVTEVMHDPSIQIAILSTKIISTLSEYLLDSSYDFIFTIDFFPIISQVCNIFHIKYICWVVDSPVMELFTKPVQNTCNRIFIFDKTQYEEVAPLNPGHIFYFPLATNVFHKNYVIQSASPSIKKHFSSDISFVGSLYTEKCPYDNLSSPPEYLKGFLDGIMEAQLKIYGYYLIDDVLTDEIIEEFKNHSLHYFYYPFESFLTDRITVSQLYIGSKISAIERVRTLNTLSALYPIDLYTTSDTKDLPLVHNKGLANSLTEMPIVFHESKINLNITSKSIRSGLPLRIFDIMGCGGFALTNYQSELPEIFEIGSELDAYSSIEELSEKIHYYLTHEKERLDIAHAGYEKVMKSYTFPIRLHQLLELAFTTD